VPSLLKVDMATWIAPRAYVELERHANPACILNAIVVPKGMTGSVHSNLVGKTARSAVLAYVIKRGE